MLVIADIYVPDARGIWALPLSRNQRFYFYSVYLKNLTFLRYPL